MDATRMSDHLPAFISKMERAGLSPVVVNTFADYYRQVVAGEKGLIYDQDIHCVEQGDITAADQLGDFAPAGRKLMSRTVKITLNGGLGTSMALPCTKSLIEAKPGITFLEVIVRQAERSGVRLALMNSFSSHPDTVSLLAKIKMARQPHLFLQHKFPKIVQKTLAPADWPQNPDLEWNPPGHGDIYTALFSSGLLQRLLDDQIIYAFLSNSDNLAATVDESLLGFMAENRISMIMEVAERTPADLKGGHLARHRNGRLVLREIAQCPPDEVAAFKNLDCYRFFNTNNIWINLVRLNERIRQQGHLRLPLILNPKSLDPQTPDSPPVYQVESAMGAAISLFDQARALKVSKSRFFPVKNCSDLLLLRSDRYRLAADSRLLQHPECTTEDIRIRLDPLYYGRIDDFAERFNEGVPSLVACEALVVEGDVRFEGGVIIKGSVRIRNSRTRQAVIKRGTVIEGDLLL